MVPHVQNWILDAKMMQNVSCGNGDKTLGSLRAHRFFQTHGRWSNSLDNMESAVPQHLPIPYSTAHQSHRNMLPLSPFQHSSRSFSLQCLIIRTSFASNDKVGARNHRIETYLIQNQVHAPLQFRAKICPESASETTGSTGTRHIAYINASVF